MSCHLTRTTPETHRLIEENLAETPVYGGWVDSTGPRYCPSIEDKIVRFRDKDSHQVTTIGYSKKPIESAVGTATRSLGLRVNVQDDKYRMSK